VIAASIFFLGIGIYPLVLALRARLVLEGTRIKVRGAWREYTAELSEIEGYRTISSRSGGYTQLWLKEDRGRIAIPRSFATDDYYRAWLQQLADLDARDRKVILDEISRQDDLGPAPEERLAALSRAKSWNVVALVLSVAAAAGRHFGPATLHLASAVTLALAPVVALLLKRRRPLLYAVFEKWSDPRADLGFILVVASIGLFIPDGSNIGFFPSKPLMLCIVLVAFAYIAPFFKSAYGNSSPERGLFALCFFALFYSLGFAMVANTLPDNSNASIYAVPVTGKHTTSGDSTGYYLELAPWGPEQKPGEISVPSSIYSKTVPGDQICFELHPGRLRAPWYGRIACPTQPAAGAAQ
jgi:hypothetical protein